MLRGERGRLCGLLAGSRARPFLGLWDLLFAPQNIHKPCWPDYGKRPSHETRLVVSAKFWLRFWVFSAPPRIGTSPCKVQFQNLKTKSLGSQLLWRGQWGMSAVWVACLKAHFGSLSRTPRRFTRVSVKIILFLLFCSDYILPPCLQDPQVLRRECACLTVDVEPLCHRSGRCLCHPLPARSWPRAPGVRGGAMQMQMGITWSSLKLALPQ